MMIILRYGFYDQEGKLQVVNYSADPQKVILNIIIHDNEKEMRSNY